MKLNIFGVWNNKNKTFKDIYFFAILYDFSSHFVATLL